MKISFFVEKIKNSRLITNISIYTIGNVLQKSAEFILLPLWSRFLSPKDYGITGVLISYIGVLLPIFTLSLQSYISYIYYKFKGEDGKLRHCISSIYVFQLFFSLFLLMLLIIFGGKLWQLIIKNDISFNPFGIIMLLITFFDGLNLIPMSLYQIQHKAKKYISLQLFTFLLNVILTVIFVIILRKGAYGKMLAMLLTYISIAIYNYIFMIKNYHIVLFDSSQISKSLLYSVPIIPHNLSSWALNAADRLILEKYVDLNLLGLYNFGYTMGLAMNVIVNAINQAWMPHYLEIMHHNVKRDIILRKELFYYILIMGSICFFGIIFNYEFIYFFIPKVYLNSVIYIPAILLGYFFVGLYKFTSAPLFFYRRTKIIAIISGFSASINIILNFIFVPNYGPVASAWITTFSYFTLFIFSYISSRRIDEVKHSFDKHFIYISLIIFVAILINKLNYLNIYSFILKIGICVFYVIFIFVLYKDNIFFGKNKILINKRNILRD
ncbi:MAG: oligosaccharide flippase family protein [Candidatus Methanofastidiosa archaeon]|nr:oligosaccharide flippase family protein [Candidatus Methanofastidiosa archaeon]